MEYAITDLQKWECHVAYDVYSGISDELCELAKSLSRLDTEVQRTARARIENMAELCVAYAGTEAIDGLHKGPIRTPVKADGSVDWDAVPVGASIWITAKEGPLAGGHVLITKRQDNMAVLSGEMKRKKVKFPPHMPPMSMEGKEKDKFRRKTEEKKEKEKKSEEKQQEPAQPKIDKKVKRREKRSKEIAARRHLAMHPGTVKVDPRTVEEEKKRRQLQAERKEKLAAARTVHKEAKDIVAAAHDHFLQSVGITKQTLTKEERSGIVDAINSHLLEHGHGEDTAQIVAESLSRSLAARNRRHTRRKAAAIADKYLAEIRARKLGYALQDHFEPDAQEGFVPSLPSAEFEVDGTRVNSPELPTDNSAPLGVPHQLNFDLPVLPEPEKLAGMTGPEIEHLIEQDLDRQEDAAYGLHVPGNPKEAVVHPLVQHDDQGRPQFAVGGTAEEKQAFEANVVDPEAVQAGIDAFLNYQEKDRQAREIRAQAPVAPIGKQFTTPAMLEDLKLDFAKFFAGDTIPSSELRAMSDDEIADLANDYAERAFRGSGDSSFYSALSPHWNDEVGNTLSKPTAEGAATALTALMNHNIIRDLGVRFETGRITETLGPEAAARLLAFKVQSLLTESTFRKFKNAVRDINAKTLENTENKAMSRHQTLLQQAEQIEKEAKAGILGDTTAEFYRADNLDRQRRNLGVALGSMSASAAFYDSLSKIHSGNLKDDSLSIMVGDSEFALKDKLAKLKLREGKNVQVEQHPDKGYIIHTTARKLDKYVGEVALHRKKKEHWEQIKNDTSDTGEYLSTPEERDKSLVRMNFPEDPEVLKEAGIPPELAGKPIKFRKNQRNDLEWLTEAGGGVVARTTGAGKTLTGLAFMGRKIAEDPSYKGLMVVPDKNVDQWINEAKVFTNLDVVKIPTKSADGKRSSTQEQRAEAYLGVNPGQVVVVSAKHAGRDFDSKLLRELGFNGMVMDEPHELVSPRRFRPHSKSIEGGKLTAGARRIMAIDAAHRVAMTATPAKLNAGEMYNMVHWTNPDAPGFRRGQGAGFNRAFGGFGEGTNAQDQAIIQALQEELAPYVSSGKLESLPFAVTHAVRKIEQTPEQRARAKSIEQGAKEAIAASIQEDWDTLTTHTKDMLERDSTRKAQWTQRAKKRAVKKLYDAHANNLRGGEDNAKINAFVEEYKNMLDAGNRHQIVFVDSQEQKAAIKAALREAGIPSSPRYLKDITKTQKPWQIEQRKTDWKTEDGPQGIMIDQKSAVGHNLQAATAVHTVGIADDAAQFAQAVGRGLRTDDSDKRTHVHVRDYRYTDSPWENYHRNEQDTQMKILAAVAPGVLGNLGIDVG